VISPPDISLASFLKNLLAEAMLKSLLMLATSVAVISSCAETEEESAKVGGPCASDSDCGGGVCWDYADHDPSCSGTICSSTCKTDAECQQKAAAAAGFLPDRARCGADGLCDLVSVGFGGFVCE
jgi:hypothetical protein